MILVPDLTHADARCKPRASGDDPVSTTQGQAVL